MENPNRTDHYDMPTKAVLQTADGRHVATASILPFQSEPDVLMWGTRLFLKTDKTKGLNPMRKRPVYREAGFAYTVLHTDECGDAFTVIDESKQ